MALLLDKNFVGRVDGMMAPDLSEKMRLLESQQSFASGSFDLHQERRWIEEYSALAVADAPAFDVRTVDDHVETPRGPVRTRRYIADDSGPTVLFVHGGGFVIGSIASHDHMARWMASEIRGSVVQVEYSLAPEHVFPAAIIEVGAVLTSLLRSSGPSRVLIAGDSAGANISAMAIMRLAGEDRSRLAGFISIYGAYAPEMNLSSHRLYGDGRFGLSEALVRWCWNLYAPQVPQEQRGKTLSPLSADLKGFPPTLCVGAECDVLLDDTLAFYGELAKASVDVTLSLWPALPHGCMHFVGVVDSVTRAAGSILQFIESRGRGESRPTALSDIPKLPAALPIIDSLPDGEDGFATDGSEGLSLFGSEQYARMSGSQRHGPVAHKVAGDIIGRVLEAGALLPNEDTASAALGVSRSAYREAIRTLSAKGLLTPQPKVGTRIAPRSQWHILDPDVLTWHLEFNASERFIRDLFELRKIVEPSAAALTALRRDERNLSNLADALARMARANPRSDAWLDAVTSFHQELLAAGGNEAVSALWPAMQATLHWSVQVQMLLPTLSLEHDPVADHARVFEKIASRNAAGALTEMALHIDAALADTISNLRRVKSERSAQAHRAAAKI